MKKLLTAAAISAVALMAQPAVAAYENADSATIKRLIKDLDAEKTEKKGAVSAFWRQVEKQGTPLIETIDGDEDNMLVTFLWKDEKSRSDLSIVVAAPFYDDEKETVRMAQLEDTSIWYKTVKIPASTRDSYDIALTAGHSPNKAASDELSIDGVLHEAFGDPLAKHIVDHGDHTHGMYEGPKAPAEPWLAEQPATPKGKLKSFTFKSKTLGNSREISVYTPPGYKKGGAPYPYAMMFDRSFFLDDTSLPTILDNLIKAGKVPPMLALLVGNAKGKRGDELPPNEGFPVFLEKELIPHLRENYNVSRNPVDVVVGGASYGGLGSTWTAYKLPHIFGNVLSQSGSYWWHPNADWDAPDRDAFMLKAGYLPNKFVEGEKLNIKFYLDVGLNEGLGMIKPNRDFRNILKAKGYDVTYAEFMGGHSMLHWRNTVSDGLIALIGTK